jgi:Protein of unknown function (DUF3822)
MVQKKLGITANTSKNLDANVSNLILEIGLNHMAIIVKNNNEIGAFELFEFEDADGNFMKIFEICQQQSSLLGLQFSATKVFINSTEALIIPAEKFTAESIEPYLQAIYGGSGEYKYQSDWVNIAHKPGCIYRTSTSIFDVLLSNFSNLTFSHVYSNLLENLLSKNTTIFEMLKVQFYQKHMIVAVVFDNKLSLLQSYPYKTAEDVIYYLLNIVQEFGLNIGSTPIEVSGMLDISSKHFELLENVFSRLSLEALSADSVFKDHLNVSNAHFYTPFVNLSK